MGQHALEFNERELFKQPGRQHHRHRTLPLDQRRIEHWVVNHRDDRRGDAEGCTEDINQRIDPRDCSHGNRGADDSSLRRSRARRDEEKTHSNADNDAEDNGDRDAHRNRQESREGSDHNSGDHRGLRRPSPVSQAISLKA